MLVDIIPEMDHMEIMISSVVVLWRVLIIHETSEISNDVRDARERLCVPERPKKDQT